ncbi:hypothetical protein [Rhodococcus ruber]|uniref:hypothetical protein n=1 Tax=Rhodococcus ruber TaxID=1830 RepID=UPI0037843EB1
MGSWHFGDSNYVKEVAGAQYQLAERYGVSDYSIRMILRKAGLPPQRRTVTVKQEDRVRELWVEGLKPEAIAAEVGMGHANVRLIVAERPRVWR